MALPPVINILLRSRGREWETLHPSPGSRKTKMPKLTRDKGPLSVEEGGLLFVFRVSAVCYVPSLHSAFYTPIAIIVSSK